MITSYQLTLGTGYIMAVEDSLVQAKKLRHFLDEKSINNAFFTNAKDALAAAHDRPPLLIISDIVMPGMDGYEFCAKIKEDPVLKDIPVILLTSLRIRSTLSRDFRRGPTTSSQSPMKRNTFCRGSIISWLIAI